MLIHDMTRQASTDLLARSRLYRLACAHEGQPYVVPIYCAYHDSCLYSFSRLGQKIVWMRANPLVCLQADELTSQQDWVTVIVLGKYEELPDTPAYEVQRKRIYELLQKHPVWWEPGCVKTTPSETTQSVEFVYFRIRVDQISGHRGVPDRALSREFSATPETTGGWLQRILGRPEQQKGGH
jgi:uncharacterized protein